MAAKGADVSLADLDQDVREYSQLSDQEVIADLLKCAIVNPQLFNTMRSLMIDHPRPSALPPDAVRLRRIFMELVND